MNLDGADLGLIAATVAGTALALWASSNVTVGGSAAALAIAAVSLLAFRAIVERVRLPRRPPAVPEYDSMILLRDSFRSGVLGRQAILTTVGGIEARVRGGGRRLLSLEEEERLKGASSEQFRSWVLRRVEELERES